MTGRYRRADGALIDASLRAHMLRIYYYMAGGLAVTRIVSYGWAATGFYQSAAFSLAQSPSWTFTTDKKEKIPAPVGS